ncbi:MAG: alpha/beta hydrolase [Proteobacteria bacterium]|nr:alpha/beta hydrolase [Burkholderiales bacterium]
MPWFSGFRTDRHAVNGTEIHFAIGGEGPPVLLLHGYPQTHFMWRHVAPRLAQRFTVVAADLRGYGDSGKPASAPDHAPYSKREMARDQVELMRALGYERFRVAGHDRGARVTHRMALDHPQAIERAAVLDIAPTLRMYENPTQAFATAYYHWFFLIQPAPFPERMIGADPAAYLRYNFGEGRPSRPAGLAPFLPDAFDEYVRCFSAEGTIHATCEDYRAAASIDLEHDRADYGQRMIGCPLLVLWGAQGVIARCFDPLADWRDYALDVRGRALPCGHYIAEELPDVCAQELDAFFA